MSAQASSPHGLGLWRPGAGFNRGGGEIGGARGRSRPAKFVMGSERVFSADVH